MEQDQPVWLIPLVVLIIFGVVALFALIFIPVLLRIARNARMTKQVTQTGLDATASIVRIWETGVRINDNPQVGMLLQVQPPGGTPFQAEVTKTVSIVELPQIQPGAQLQVKYDPADTSRVAIIAVIAGGGAAGCCAAVSGCWSGATRPGRCVIPVIQSIVWFGPATNPSSDMVKCQSTLPAAVCRPCLASAWCGCSAWSLRWT